MGSFLKKILEPSEQDVFDHLTWTEKPSVDTFGGLCSEAVLSSANVGLPGHLVPRQRPRPAYVTHTGPLVRVLLQQEQPGKAPPAHPAGPQPSSEPGEAASEEETQVLSTGSSTAGLGEDSVGMPKDKSSLPPPSVGHRVIFARKPPSTVLPWSSLACSSKRE